LKKIPSLASQCSYKKVPLKSSAIADCLKLDFYSSFQSLQIHQILHTHRPRIAVATKSNLTWEKISIEYIFITPKIMCASHKHKQLISEKSLKMHKVYKYHRFHLFFDLLLCSVRIERVYLSHMIVRWNEARSWHFRFCSLHFFLYFYRRRLKRFLTSEKKIISGGLKARGTNTLCRRNCRARDEKRVMMTI
jgi:hypothetical protein